MHVKKALMASKNENVQKSDIEDYALAVNTLNQLFQYYDAKDFTTDLVQQLTQSFKSICFLG